MDIAVLQLASIRFAGIDKSTGRGEPAELGEKPMPSSWSVLISNLAVQDQGPAAMESSRCPAAVLLLGALRWSTPESAAQVSSHSRLFLPNHS